MIIVVEITDGYEWYGEDVIDIGDKSIEEVKPVLEDYYSKKFMPKTIVEISESPRVEIAPGIVLL
jgi:hypothetical protein